MFTADRIDADIALRMGFVQSIHDESTLEMKWQPPTKSGKCTRLSKP